MSNIGREIIVRGQVIGSVVEEGTKRGKATYKIRLADHMPRNAALGDYQLIIGDPEFADDRRPVFAESANLGFVDMRQISRRQSYNR